MIQCDSFQVLSIASITYTNALNEMLKPVQRDKKSVSFRTRSWTWFRIYPFRNLGFGNNHKSIASVL